METLSNMETVCTRLRGEIEEMNRGMLAFPSSAELMNDLRSIFYVEQDVVMNDIESANGDVGKNTKANSPRTPNIKSTAGSHFDFDAFPHTPTLAQLGISDTTLAIVGEAKQKSKLGQISDSDSEYRLSPSGSIALSLVNTIPSMHAFISG